LLSNIFTNVCIKIWNSFNQWWKKDLGWKKLEAENLGSDLLWYRLMKLNTWDAWVKYGGRSLVMCTAVLIVWGPATPPLPIWAHIRGRYYWPAKIDDISLWPLESQHHIEYFNRTYDHSPFSIDEINIFYLFFILTGDL
jgi:hypothetical protein